MSEREEYAKAALIGLLSSGKTQLPDTPETYAQMAWMYADAMVAEKRKRDSQ